VPRYHFGSKLRWTWLPLSWSWRISPRSVRASRDARSSGTARRPDGELELRLAKPSPLVSKAYESPRYLRQFFGATS